MTKNENMQFHFTACQSLKVKRLNYSHLMIPVCELPAADLISEYRAIGSIRVQGFTMLLNIPVSMRKRCHPGGHVTKQICITELWKELYKKFQQLYIKKQNKTKQKLQQII